MFQETGEWRLTVYLLQVFVPICKVVDVILSDVDFEGRRTSQKERMSVGKCLVV